MTVITTTKYYCFYLPCSTYWLSFDLNWIESNLFLCSVISKSYKTTGCKTCQPKYSYKIYKRHINNVSIKCKCAEPIKDIGVKYKYTRNSRRLQISINDEDSYEERQIYVSNDTYHNMTYIYI